MARIDWLDLIFGTLLVAVVAAFFLFPDPPSSGAAMSVQMLDAN